MSEWIKCSDEMPPMEIRVLAWNSRYQIAEIVSRIRPFNWDGHGVVEWCDDETGDPMYYPLDECTHWQHLPEPPTKEPK